MWDEFVLINLTRSELGDQRKLLHMVDWNLIWMQHIYSDKFTYLGKSVDKMISLTDIYAR